MKLVCFLLDYFIVANLACLYISDVGGGKMEL